MSRGSQTFRQTDLTRAVKALVAAGKLVRGEPLMRITVQMIRKNDPRLHRYATWQRSRRRGKGFDLSMIAPDRIIEIAKECNVSGRIAA